MSSTNVKNCAPPTGAMLRHVAPVARGLAWEVAHELRDEPGEQAKTGGRHAMARKAGLPCHGMLPTPAKRMIQAAAGRRPHKATTHVEDHGNLQDVEPAHAVHVEELAERVEELAIRVEERAPVHADKRVPVHGPDPHEVVGEGVVHDTVYGQDHYVHVDDVRAGEELVEPVPTLVAQH